MQLFEDYNNLEKIYESNNSLVYRAIRDNDGKKVILKILKESFPSVRQISRYKQEFEITRFLENIPGVIKAYYLKEFQNTLLMTLEDFGGVSLNLLKEQFFENYATLLEIFINITKILGNIHQAGVNHKDINPSNIVYNPESKILKLIDFGISTKFSEQTALFKNSDMLEGTLAYISPEQTGRVNRSIDYRSDYYSLGISMYEMFCGQLPFQTSDSINLIHCHIAVQPTPPININPQLPEELSAIILKLMSKNPEDRYKSTEGLCKDLLIIKDILGNKKLQRKFFPGSQDFSEQLIIPEKLYGREREIEALKNTLAKVNVPPVELLLVSGYSGIGKSSLIREMYNFLPKGLGYFCSGKFDQYQQNIPYNAFSYAFSDFFSQILTEKPEKLQNWKDRLREAIKDNGTAINEVIPELKLLCGPFKEISRMDSAESQNRFKYIFIQFIKAVCNPDMPLILFLDDLQWADSASLKLLELIYKEKELCGLIIIGAYRDNEVSPIHPLIKTISSLRENKTLITEIQLGNLPKESVSEILKDTLSKQTAEILELRELIYEKTEGNPFFLKQFLYSLHQNGQIYLQKDASTASNHWNWNMGEIRSQNITDNVIDLMVSRLKKLELTEQKLLSYAACFGNEFELQILALTSSLSQNEAFERLAPSLRLGFILSQSNMELEDTKDKNAKLVIKKFRFLHDRVQQAAYLLTEESEKKEIHLRIGRMLLKKYSENDLQYKIFDIVSHLNKSLALLESTDRKLEIVRLNLTAAKKAKDATAYTASAQFINIALQLLPKNSWENLPELSADLHVEGIEIAYLNGNFELFDTLVYETKKYNLDIARLARITQVILLTETARRRLEVGKIETVEFLKKFGITFPKNASFEDVGNIIGEIHQKLVSEPFDNLLDKPISDNPELHHIMPILFLGASLIHELDPILTVLLILKGITLTIEEGNTIYASIAYLCFAGLIYNGQMEEYQLGYELGNTAMKLFHKFGDRSVEARAMLIYYGNIFHWMHPIQENIHNLFKTYYSGRETGNIEYAVYAIHHAVWDMIYTGEPLSEIYKTILDYYDELIKLNHERPIIWLSAIIWRLNHLIGTTEAEDYKQIPVDIERELIKAEKENDYHTVFWICFEQAVFSLLFNKEKEAHEFINRVKPFIPGHPGQIQIPVFYFYESLCCILNYPQADKETQKEYLDIVTHNQTKLKKVIALCPDNFQHKYQLIEAEIANILGKYGEARELYDEAIESAKKFNYLNIEALSNEQAGIFYQKRNLDKLAALYIKEAYFLYSKWGALTKAAQLKKKYPQYFIFEQSNSKNSITTTSTNNSIVSSTYKLDVNSLMKSAQALSEEKELHLLLPKMMTILMENVGAKYGLLLQPKNGSFRVLSKGKVSNEKIETDTSEVILEYDYPQTVIEYVCRIKNYLLSQNISENKNFQNDFYIKNNQITSVICFPVIRDDEIKLIIYLENNLFHGTFTEHHIETLKLFSAQIVISLENAEFYKDLENKVKQRTIQLEKINKELESSRALLSKTGKIAKVGGWEYVIKTEKLFWSEETYRIHEVNLNYQPNVEEAINFYHPDDRNKILSLFQKALETGERFDEKLRLITTKGKQIWVHAIGEAVYDGDELVSVSGTFQDVTDQKRTELILQESETIYLNFFESTFEGIVLHDQGVTIEINPTFLKIFGYSQEDKESLIGTSVLNFLAEESHESIIQAMKDDEVRPYFNLEQNESHIGKKKDGTKFDVMIMGRPFQYKGRNIRMASVADVTERLRVQNDLKLAKEEAEQANKAKSRFLANMSHELRTPLNSILGFSQIISHSKNLDSNDHEKINIIQKNGEHLLNLINDILDMSKIEAGYTSLNTNDFDLYRLFDDIHSLFSVKADRKGINLDFEIGKNVPRYIHSDESKLRQVMINLIGNAIKFTKKGFVKVKVTYNSTNNYLYTAVKDSGFGIAANELENIFEIFTQSESGMKSSEGTGLGLPISKKFIELLDGKIKVRSKTGKGSIFLFSVKIKKATAIPIKEIDTREIYGIESGQKDIKVLIVDDIEDNRTLLENICYAMNFASQSAENGKEAVEFAESFKPDIILMDIVMPEMDGYEATREIRNKGNKDVKIIAITASTFLEEEQKVIQVGCDDFIRKPFKENEILEKIGKLCGIRFLYREKDTTPENKLNQDTIIKRIKKLPPHIVSDLRKFVQSSMVMETESMIQEIAKLDSQLAKHLKDLAEEFQYEQIYDLIS
ncbi:MAG: AAA family ATPase [Leptospiraceae bacterium]|nr:AAA family ATPase [Leptospiraceae bacterium]